MDPLALHLAEQLAAAFLRNEAMENVLKDTNERLHMAIGEVQHLNTFLAGHERTMLRLEQDNSRLIATVARNELELQSMRNIIRTLQESVSVYRGEEKAKALSSKRKFPRSFETFLEEARERQRGELEERIREQLDNPRNRNIRRRLDFTQIEEDEENAQPPLRYD